MDELERLIHHYEVILEVQSYLLEPSAVAMVEKTIKYLKELQLLKDEV